MTFAGRAFSFVITLLIPAVLPGQIAIEELHCEGNHRLRERGVILASGLKVKDQVAPAGLDAAAQRLIDTGLFTGVSYRYTPRGQDVSAGYSVTLVVTEEAARQKVVLDVTGVDPQEVWTLAEKDFSLIDHVIPSQATASAYYVHEIEGVLAKAGHPQRVTIQDESDLATRETLAVIQSADRPKIADIMFDGNAAVSSGAIRDRIVKITVGNPYSERDFRRILDANIRPLFEEKGLLQVSFREVRTASGGDGKVIVTTSIDDGSVWRLGKVGVQGDELPTDKMLAAGKFATGRVANWTEFLAGVRNMETVLKHDGYIGAASTPVRAFQQGTGIVDVRVNVRKGKQFRFASIEVTGLPEAERQKALALWRLRAGQPMDEPYLAEYLKSVALVVSPSKKSVSPGMRVRPGTDQVDVIIAYR